MKVLLGRRYRFTAAHRLHNPALSDAENRAMYGKCNNPYGHGHDYEAEIVVGGEIDGATGRVMDLAVLDLIAQEQILRPYAYQDLNRAMKSVPTTENFASEVMARLRAVWPVGVAHLETVRIWETERNICQVDNQNE